MVVDEQIILQIFGGILKKPSILTETDVYRLDTTDFYTHFQKILFASLANMVGNGLQKITVADVDTYLQQHGDAYQTFTKNNGIEYLQDAEELSDVDNFEYYYKKLKKFNAIRDLQKMGYDTSSIYPEKDMLDEKDYALREKFEDLDITQIFESVKTKIAIVEEKYACSETETSLINKNVRELLKDLKEKPEVGAPLQGEIFNTVVRGARLGKFYLMSAGSGTGKAIPNSVNIPTPNGVRKIGDIRVGDYVFGRDGKPTKILKIYPQGKKDVYEITFKDGRKAKCCSEHLWGFYYDSHREKRYKVEDLNWLLKKKETIGLQDKKGRYRYSIPLNQAVEYPEKQYSLHPYIMGAFLGDGSFRYNNRQKALSFSSENEELPARIAKIYGCNFRKNSKYNYNWTFTYLEQKPHTSIWVEEFLRDYPGLWQTYSEDKYIPEDYLMGSVEQRKDLLRGLLDTDGTIDEKGRIGFFSISERMAKQVVYLANSLGYIAIIHEDHSNVKYQKTNGICYRVQIQAPVEEKKNLFTLQRKIDRAIFNEKREIRREDKTRLAIVDIQKLDYQEDMTCFTVEADDHLFLINDFITTHNTRCMVGNASYIAYPIRYDSKRGEWINTGACEKVMYIGSEQKMDEIQTMIIAYLTDINEEKILYGTYNADEAHRIDIATEIMDIYSDNFIFTRLPEPNLAQVKSHVRMNVLSNHVNYVFYDYIFATPSLLNEFRDLAIRPDVALRMLSTLLKDLSAELNVFIMSATQITGKMEFKLGYIRNENMLRDSKSIPDKADICFIRARILPEEMELIGPLCERIGRVPNQVSDVYKVRRGKYVDVRIWHSIDLGTCRTEDLFITDANLSEVNGFVPKYLVLNYGDDIHQKIDEFLDLFNNGEATSTQIKQSDYTAGEPEVESGPTKKFDNLLDF